MDEISKRVWIENEAGETAEEIYVSATIKSVDGDKFTIETSDGKERILGKDKFWYCNPPILEGTDDLTSLSHMHEPAVLHNLKLRYLRNQIYSKSGPILIAVNPYQSLPIYSDGLLAAYCDESTRQLPPHVYAIGDQAFRAMVNYGRNQSILVTGESGAGKTETTKIILQYFATKGRKSDQSNVQEKVLESTPILEAFGNAKTLRNDNSSRFGKFIIVDFDSNGSIVGARLKTYLLEKSRLLHQAKGERNYHIFFELIAACKKDPGILPSVSSWKVRNLEDYNYLHTGGDLDLGKDESKNFSKTRKALEVVGLSVDEIDNICTLLMGILSLGNIQFENNDKDHATLKTSAKEWVPLTCELLGFDESPLLKSISTKVMTTGRDSYEIPLDSKQAEVARDSLATLLYETLFLWLVERINESIATKEGNAKNFIGILDIYGFESFTVNSFEQFCINYANEKLQQQFNQHMFKLEQEEYHKEEIDWTDVKFSDNQLCISLIEKHLGIISILNEESRFPKATPETLTEKLTQKNSRHPYYEKSTYHNHGFIIKHYPGAVEYDSKQFLDKNRNLSLSEYLNLLQKCKRNWVTELFVGSQAPARTVKNSEGGQAQTIASQFKDSLLLLMDTIHQTEANYIRCIKPNNNKKPLEFGQRQVLDQLRCNGVLEAIRIARDGFPTRYIYSAFWVRFRMLADIGMSSDQVKTQEDYISAVKKLMGKISEQYKLERFQFGKTKLFFKGGQLAFLEDLRTKKRNDAAVVIQKYIRSSNEIIKYKRFQAATKILQAIYRMKSAREQSEIIRRKKSSTIIQRYIRMWNKRTAYVVELNREHAATLLQKFIRMWKVASSFRECRTNVVVLQSRWRAIMARRQFRKVKQEALKAANLLQENRKLLDRIQQLQTELAANTFTKASAEETARNEAERLALRAKVESYEAELESKTQTIAQLQQADAKSAKKLGVMRDLEKRVESAAKLEEEGKCNLAAKEKIIGELSADKNEMMKNMEALKLELESVRRNMTTMSQEKVKAMEDMLFKKNELLSELSIELENMKASLVITQKDSEEEKKLLEGKLEKVKSKLDTDRQLLEKLQVDYDQSIVALTALKKELERSNQDFDQEKHFLVTRVEQLQADLLQKSTEITNLQSENLKFKGDQETLSQNLEKSRSESEKEKRSYEEKIQKLGRDINEQNRDLTDLRDQLEQLQTSKNLQLKSNQEITVQFEEEKRRWMEKTQKYETEIRSKNEEISTLNLEKQQLVLNRDYEKKDAEENLLNLTREKVRFESIISELKSEVTEKTAVIEQIQKSQQKQDEESRLLRKKYNSLTCQLEAANPNIQHESIGEHLKQLENEVIEKNQSISKLEMENQQLQGKLQAINQDALNTSANFVKEKQRLEKELQNMKFSVTEKTETVKMLELKIEQLNSLSKVRSQDLEDTKEALLLEKTRSQSFNEKLTIEVNQSTTTITELQLENQRLINSQSQEITRLQEEFDLEKTRLEDELRQKEEDLSITSQKLSQMNLTQHQLSSKHQQELDRLSFEAEHEKILMEKKIKQFESALEEKTNEVRVMLQSSHKMSSKQGATSQLVDEIKVNLEHEKKKHQEWRGKYNQLKLDSEKQLKEQRELYTILLQEQRDENLRIMNEQREDFQKKLRSATPTLKGSLNVPSLSVPDVVVGPLVNSPRFIEKAKEKVRENKTRKDRPTSETSKPKKETSKKSHRGERGQPRNNAPRHRSRRPVESDNNGGISASADSSIYYYGDTEDQRPFDVERPPDDVEKRDLEWMERENEKHAAAALRPAQSTLSTGSRSSNTTEEDSRFVVSIIKKGPSFFRRLSSTATNIEEPPPKKVQPPSSVKAGKTGAEENRKALLASRASKSSLVPDLYQDPSGMAPEKMIAAALSNLSPARSVQLRTLSESVLSIEFQEQLLMVSETITVSGIPLPSFILLRYIVYVQYIDSKFFRSTDIFCVPTTIQSYIEKTDKMEDLVGYLNITAVLLHTLSSLMDCPPSSDYVGMSIHLIQGTVELTEPNFPRNDTPSKIQLVFAQIYGKTLHHLMKHLHGELKNHLLIPSTPGPNEVVTVLLQYLQCFQRNCMVPALVQQFFTDVFTFMDGTIFNEIILRKDLCTFSSAFQLKMALEEIVQTLSDQGGNMLGNMDSWFIHTRQIISCLTLDKKLLCQPEIRKQVCPDISLVQLKQMCSHYECEEFENAILSEVITNLMGDPEFDLSQPLLVNVSAIRVNTKNVHYTEPMDIQNMGFSMDLVTVVLKQIKNPVL